MSNKIKTLLFGLLLVLGLSASAEAQTICNGLTPTIWAAPSAQGSGNGSSEANAVALTTAVATATAGDVICLSPGTYVGTYNASIHAEPIFRFANDGTNGNPITLTCKYRAVELALEGVIGSDNRRCEFQYTGGSVGTNTTQPLLGGSDTDSYLEFYGLYIQANTSVAPCRPSHGCFKITGAGHRYEWNVIDQGTTNSLLDDDNFTPFFSLGGDDWVVRNNWVRGGDNGTLQHPNASVLTMYGSRNFLIEHNTLEGVTSGFFVKGSNSSQVNSGTIRYNKIQAGGYGIMATADIEPEGVFIYQNIVYNGTVGIQFNPSVGALGDPLHVYNNTLYQFATRGGATGGFYAAQTVGSNLRFYNNIIMFPASTSAPMIDANGIAFDAVSPLDYNLYYEASGTASWLGNGSTYSSLANWRTYTGDEANSVVSDPLFVDASSADFHLGGSSPALTLGRVGGVGGGSTIPAGAYITGDEVIGICADSDCETEVETPPARPARIRVRGE